MKFGLFCLIPQRDLRRNPGELVREALERTKLAEALDFETVWFAEHHFSNYSMIPSPLMMCAHAAGLTKTIKLGTGVVVMPLYEPVRLVEEIAFVDQVSDGRLQLGIGSGYQDYEFQHFGRKLADCHAQTLEMLDVIEMACLKGVIDYAGKFYKIPATAIGLRPKQKPLPPVYVAGLAQDMAVQARVAQSGYVPFLPQHQRPASALVEARAKLAQLWKSAGRSGMPFATQRMIFVTRNKGEEMEAAEHIRYTLRLALGLRFNTAELDGPMLREMPVANEPTLEQILEHAPMGSPERVAKALADDIRTLQPSHLSLMFQYGGLTHRQAMASMELFGREVLPILQKEFGDLAKINGAAVPQRPMAVPA